MLDYESKNSLRYWSQILENKYYYAYDYSFTCCWWTGKIHLIPFYWVYINPRQTLSQWNSYDNNRLLWCLYQLPWQCKTRYRDNGPFQLGMSGLLVALEVFVKLWHSVCDILLNSVPKHEFIYKCLSYWQFLYQILWLQFIWDDITDYFWGTHLLSRECALDFSCWKGTSASCLLHGTQTLYILLRMMTTNLIAQQALICGLCMVATYTIQ